MDKMEEAREVGVVYESLIFIAYGRHTDVTSSIVDERTADSVIRRYDQVCRMFSGYIVYLDGNPTIMEALTQRHAMAMAIQMFPTCRIVCREADLSQNQESGY